MANRFTAKLFACRPLFPVVFCVIWLVGILAGVCWVFKYEGQAGAQSAAPPHWPTGIFRPDTALSLVMVVHPHCPCSRASVAELAQLMAHSYRKLSATVLFVRYKQVSPNWVHTDLWNQAAAIPNVHVFQDNEGALAHRFGALTSGQTFIYDKSGRLLFQGGLTGARGHEGDNAGLDAALAVMHEIPHRASETAVFGCPLFAHAEAGVTSPENTRKCHP